MYPPVRAQHSGRSPDSSPDEGPARPQRRAPEPAAWADGPPGTSLARKAAAELLGTAGLLCAVIGSGIMAQRLAGGDTAVALLANSLATLLALYALIEVFAPLSGAHFNPVVSGVLALRGALPLPHLPLYVAAQLAGAVLGAWLAHAMFDLAVFQWSTSVRAGPGQWLSEGVATAGLVIVVLQAPPARLPAIAACYIGAAIWFTASSSFANPAGVLGRMFSDTFTGIAPSSAAPFVVAELAGMAVGVLVSCLLRQERLPFSFPASWRPWAWAAHRAPALASLSARP